MWVYYGGITVLEKGRLELWGTVRSSPCILELQDLRSIAVIAHRRNTRYAAEYARQPRHYALVTRTILCLR